MDKKNIVIGVTGGIACYKAVDIVNTFVKKGHNVDVMMTENACEFVTPLTFQTMSHNKVITDMFSKVDQWDTKHISLAQKADLFLVVPATANIIGKMANGIADDMLSTTLLATKAPIVVAPAMNTGMWENPIVQDNIQKLKNYGITVLDTDHGRLACGDIGGGKLLAVDKIVDQVETIF